MSNLDLSKQLPLLPTFGASFLEDHARLIISDPKIALIELVANSWDAGSDKVDILWPVPSPDKISVKDNGTGMTMEEFSYRWCELNYNRKEVQGEDVLFPEGNKSSFRKAFGTNGKGRHSMFCFNDIYFVRTWRDGVENTFQVERSHGTSPFQIRLLTQTKSTGHGTEIYTEMHRHDLHLQVVRELIGSKFIADPAFQITVNNEIVKLTELEHLGEKRNISIKGIGAFSIMAIDSQKTGRTSKQNGVAWWVHKRLVGEPSWRGFDDEAFLDARSSEAKRYTFIVEADILSKYVSDDWSSFRQEDAVQEVHSIAKKNILEMLRSLMGDIHKSRKLVALEGSRNELKDLPAESLNYIGQVLDDVQGKYPSFGERELSATLEVITNLEKSRQGFNLLEQLSTLSPDDLDQLSDLLSKWSIREAQIVLNELEKRLKIIENLEKLVENPSTDELHELQPLFERGLWIFGPEYESIEYTSNRTLITVLQELFQSQVDRPLKFPKKRPDFVILPDSTMGIYSRDSYDDRGEPKGLDKVLIVELKKGGFQITSKELEQVQTYIRELRKGKRVQKSTQIIAFVLGATISEDADTITLGENNQSIINPRTYSIILRMAHARTFNLLKAIQNIKRESLSDEEIGIVLGVPTIKN